LDSEGSKDIPSHEDTVAALDMETEGRIGTVGLETRTCPAVLNAFEQTLRKQYLFTFPAKTLTKSPGLTNAVDVALLGRSASTR
jgi:hypothetical protein